MKRNLFVMLAFVLLFLSLSSPMAVAENEEASFVKLGLADRVVDLSDAVGKTYEYITADTPGGSHEITTELSVNWATFENPDIRVYLPEGAEPAIADSFPGLDEELAILEMLVAGMEFEWRGVEVTIDYGNSPNWAYWAAFEDYNDTDQWDESAEKVSHAESHLVPGDDFATFSYVMMFGKKSGNTMTIDLFAYVPAGYDGTVLTLMSATANSQSTWPAGKHFYDYMNDNSLFFRMR